MIHPPGLQPASTSSQPQSATPPPAGRTEGRQQDLTVWLLLLLILCLGSLGSLSLARPLLPTTTIDTRPPSNGKNVGTIMQKAVSTPTPVTFTDGQCTTTPQQITYRSGSSATSEPPTLPADWFTGGRKQADFALAQSCAASFVMAYQTFDVSKPTTLESFTYMLSAGAKQRFYGLIPSIKADIRLDPAWRASMQKQHLSQVTQVYPPGLIDARYTHQKLLVWMAVPFLTSTTTNKHTVTQQGEYSVLLVAVPPDPQKSGTGWQVSAWQHGASFFPPYEPL
jgi:hypothetical protein